MRCRQLFTIDLAWLCLVLQLTTTLRQKEQTAEDCRNSYILQLEKTNAERQKHYHSTMPAVFKVKGHYRVIELLLPWQRVACGIRIFLLLLLDMKFVFGKGHQVLLHDL